MNCPQCKREFLADRPGRVFCSRKCKGDCERKKIDLEKLAAMAAAGDKGTYIAAVLGVSPPTITRAMRTHGFYAQWLGAALCLKVK